MPDINWGILQPLQHMAPVNSASPQASGGSAPLVSPNAGTSGLLDAQRLQMEQARQPGLLQQQQLVNQGLLSENQTKDIQAKTAQEEYIHHQADLQAYKKGGIEAYTTSLESHDPIAATTLKNSIETTKEAIREHGVAAVSDTANLWHTIVPSDYNPNDPKSNQELLSNYEKNRKLLKRLDPSMPELNSPSEISNYGMGVVHTIYGYKEEKKLEGDIRLKVAEKDLTKTDLQKAQEYSEDLQREYDSLPDKKSPEAQALALKLKQAKQEAQSIPSGKSPWAQLESNIGEGISSGASAIGKGISDIGKDKPTTNPISMPLFNSKDEFQSWFKGLSPAEQESVKTQLGNK